MDVLAWTEAIIERLSTITDTVIYGSLAITAAAISCMSYLAIISSFYRAVAEMSSTDAEFLGKLPVFLLRCLLASVSKRCSYCRTTNPVLPPTKALGAALVLLTPVALMVLCLGKLGEASGIYFTYTFSPALVLASVCGTPLLLWVPAVWLTAYPPFRDMHMPARPELARAEQPALSSTGGGAGAGVGSIQEEEAKVGEEERETVQYGTEEPAIAAGLASQKAD